MQEGLTLGIDEAGRGAQIGPLVVAGVVLSDDASSELLSVGLCDSKRLTVSRKRALVGSIRQLAAWIGVEVRSAAVVDRYVGRVGMKHRTTLNALERRMASALIRRAPCGVPVIADGEALFGRLGRRLQGFMAEDHADVTKPAVMAAALVAKVERDRLLAKIDQLAQSLCGSIPRNGYPGITTTDWIARYRRFFGACPPELRQSWGSRAGALSRE